MKKACTRFLVLFLCLVSVFSISAQAANSAQDQMDILMTLSGLLADYALDNESDSPIYDALVDLLERHPELYSELAKLMTDKLDPYTNLFSGEEFNAHYPAGAGYVGIGIVLDATRDTGFFVESVVASGPAGLAGILAGDQVVSVDGRDVTSFPPQVSASLTRGEAGTTVKLGVKRNGESLIRSFTITRAALTTTSVSYQDMGGGVGYIRIGGFGSLTDFMTFVTTYERIPYEGIRSVIIDLRGNPGGDMNVMFNMLNYVVEKKGTVLFGTQEVSQANPKLFLADGLARWTPNKLVVLVDENSASASEVFAGALQCHNLADTVGVTTHGKGRGQYVFFMGDEEDTAAIITAIDLILPDSTKYDKKGITPKYVVPLLEMPYPETELRPLSLSRAVLPSVKSARVAALEQRLELVGAFLCKPDKIWTDYTTYALNLFQRQHNLKETDHADIATLKVLDKEAAAVLTSTIIFDSQLEKAVELAGKAAERPLDNPPPEKDI